MLVSPGITVILLVAIAIGGALCVEPIAKIVKVRTKSCWENKFFTAFMMLVMSVLSYALWLKFNPKEPDYHISEQDEISMLLLEIESLRSDLEETNRKIESLRRDVDEHDFRVMELEKP